MDKDMMESIDKNNHFNKADMIQSKPDMITPIDKTDMTQPMPDKNNYFNRSDMITPIDKANMIQPDYDIYEHFEEDDEQTIHRRR